MDSNDELKEIDIKNRTCYYFHDIIKIEDFNLDNILIYEKSYENILVHNISYKTLTDAKPLRIRFDKIDGFIRVYDGTRHLVLFRSERHDFIYKSARNLIEVSGTTYVIPLNYAKIKVDSHVSLPLTEIMIIHNVIILINSVFNKDKNNYYYNIFSEKASYELPKK